MPRSEPRPLTVVIVVDHAFISGGQSMVAFESALGLRRRGYQPIVFAAAGPVDPVLTAAGIRVVCLDQSDLVGNPSKLAAAWQGLWNAKAADELGRLLDTLPRETTIVHVHGWAKALSPSIAGPIARSGLPAVYTIHEYFLFCPNGGFFNYQKQAICHLDPLSARCWATNCDSRTYPRKLWRGARQVVMERVAGLPTVFSDYVCLSRLQGEIVGGLLPAGKRLHFIANPIATVDLGPKPDAAKGDIVFVGRISPEKGPLLYAEAARLNGMTPVFIGDGPAAPEVMHRFPEARMLGWHDKAGVRSALRDARAMVFPSLWYEGQPLTVLEAKSLGTPVIVSDSCAARESIEDGVTGLWFKAGDAADLAHAMRALSDDTTVVRMSAAAYAAFWRDPPSVERHVDAITALYADLTGTAAPAADRAA